MRVVADGRGLSGGRKLVVLAQKDFGRGEAKLVDGLLDVAHGEEVVGPRRIASARDEAENRVLHGVDVLVLVHEDELETVAASAGRFALVLSRAGRRPAPQSAGRFAAGRAAPLGVAHNAQGELLQVVEVERALAALGGGIVALETAGQVEQQVHFGGRGGVGTRGIAGVQGREVAGDVVLPSCYPRLSVGA